MNTAIPSAAAWAGTPRRETDAAQAAGIALWAFIGVATTLFSLFIVTYAMRMDGSADWSRLAMPKVLWLSSALLVAGSVLLQRAARAGDAAAARRTLLAGGACAMAFVVAQAAGWQALIEARVAPAGNPAASFFYLLTALHALHVVGGLAGWAVALRHPARWRTALVARYWHFLLGAWAVLFAALGWLTPDVVAFVCGRG